MKKIVSLLVMMCLTVVSLSACSNVTVSNNNKNKVVIATTFAVYDWARNVAKDTTGIEVKYIVDSAVDLHSYQPSADDIFQYMTADMILAIGGESEEWLNDIELKDGACIQLINYIDAKEEELVEGMQGEEEEPEELEENEEESEYDEHIWLSLKNASVCTKVIADEFSKLIPENKETFNKNAEDYCTQLASIDSEFEKVVASSSVNTLLFGDRFPFRYMVDDYGIDYYAAFIGCSAETEARFETIVFLSEKVDELGLKYVCTIGGNKGIAEQIIENTSSKNQEIIEFDSIQSVTKTQANDINYIDIMRKNLEALKTALSK